MLTDRLQEERSSEAPKIQPNLARANILDWKFDILHLEETEKRPLVWLGMRIFAAFDTCKHLKIDEHILKNWLSLIEDHYHAENPYHNATHAADVLHATAFYLNTSALQNVLDPLEKISCLIAAVIHDTDHPGKTSSFLINSNDPLALLYNDRSILESHHSALAFRLTLKDSSVNIFQNLDKAVYRNLRESIVDMVLATDMTQHKVHVTNFTNTLETVGEGEPFPKKNIEYLKRMLIKCADVSNPARPLRMAVQWAQRITEEFFRQTDEEIARNLPVTLPMYNRNTCSFPASQIGFYRFFINDLYNIWHDFTNLPELMRIYNRNFDFWKDLESKHIQTPQDVSNYLMNNPFDPNED
jgi:high affinity cAMP-specific and IBMX-insensitive 3',5'-cyclic phosphodiesterase 8